MPCASHNRKTFMLFAVFVNLIAMVFVLLSCISGLASDKALVKALPWVTGEAPATMGPWKTYISITSRVDRMECGLGQFQSVCNSTRFPAAEGWVWQEEGAFERSVEWSQASACTQALDVATCEKCRDNALTSASLVLAIVGQMATITSNLQRSTVYGDVNCQAFWGVGSNVMSFFSSLTSLLSFRSACYQALPSGPTWKLGIAFHAVALTLVFKIVDAVFHFILPTPEVRWHKPPGEVASIEDYMSLACEDIELTNLNDLEQEREMKEAARGPSAATIGAQQRA
eukprot:CAMPEP_0178404400 /NCGR_PEP_ID=MMETSP0689_2-20121128/17863_1 /TAXON_ID=160604 /ORGANISM="Amphidinium massartii, Strain CS-259" /LENGTH=284 /DNA_ID=CAMNT_0020025381 /DNA_START=200 /DNA_END=1054 /DNA_ORIENTATION=-